MKKKLIFKLTFLLCTLMLTLSSCRNEAEVEVAEGEDPWCEDIQLSPKSRAAADELTSFYPSFTSDVAEYIDSYAKEGDGNFVVSPISASFVLAMMANGVEGELKDEILSYLCTDDTEGMNELAQTLMNILPGIDRKTRLSLANSVWTSNNLELSTDFSNLMSQSFGSRNFSFNPNDGATTARDVNRWCAQNTANEITDFLNPAAVDTDLMVMLLNALFFKSEWRTLDLFPENRTEDRPFFGRSGQTQVPTMKSFRTYMDGYFDDDLSYVRVNFGNGAYGLEIFLPSEQSNVMELSRTLADKYDRIKDEALFYKHIVLYLPKFKVKGNLDLNDILSAGGLAHLSQPTEMSMFTQPVSGMVSFRQNLSFEIDEKGAKAVVVSSASGTETINLSPDDPIDLEINRPFLFFITEKSTGACIISGRITDL